MKTRLLALPALLLVATFAADPVWSPDGRSIVYSGRDVGTTFPIRVVNADGRVPPQPNITLSRGARRIVFLPGTRELVILRGEMNGQNFWIVDLDRRTERQLTNFRATSPSATSTCRRTDGRSCSIAIRTNPTS